MGRSPLWEGGQGASRWAGDPRDALPRDENVGAIVDLERAALARRSRIERLSDGITGFLGSSLFLVLHVIWFACWIVAGLQIVPGVPAFDHFPFGLLTMIVSLEAIFLAIFVLISQNRMARLADRRAHLDLQVNMLAEQEITSILRLVQEIRDQLGIASGNDVELARQLRPTDVKTLSAELEQQLPGE